MARHYKIGQFLQTDTKFGRISAVTTTGTGTYYTLEDDSRVLPEEVVAVGRLRPVKYVAGTLAKASKKSTNSKHASA